MKKNDKLQLCRCQRDLQILYKFCHHASLKQIGARSLGGGEDELGKLKTLSYDSI